MKETGSYVYILSRNTAFKEIVHKKTLNEAKFYGFDYFFKEDKPFYRFTKMPFPHLFYVSEGYIIYVEYARLKDKDIPYVRELSPYDKEIEEVILPMFTKAFDKNFVYDPDARAKYRDLPKRTFKKNTIKRKERDSRIDYHNAYSD